MKKILLSLTVLAAPFVAGAASVTTNPDLNYFSENFDGGISSDWNMYGAGKTNVDEVAGWFQEGKSYTGLTFTDGTTVAMSNSWTVEGGTVDEWLISPAINIPVDDAMLVFTAVAYGATTDSNYSIYVSTTGNTKEDFTDAPIYDAKLRGDSYGGVVTRTVRQMLSGYKGQNVYLAFVNCSTDAALLGFTDIKVCEYDIAVTNETPSFLIEPGQIDFNFAVQMRTPYACSSYTATLETSTGVNESVTIEKNLKSSYSTTKPTFSPISLSEVGETMTYKLTITPDMEGATPTVVSSGCALATTYPGVCVMEEATGEYCAYCTRGIAALDYFSATYGDQFIGIAVHCGGYSTGAMEFASYDPLLSEGISGFPAAVFNRAEVSDPSQETTVKRLVNKQSPAKISIHEVAYDPESEDQMVTVTYNPTLGYSAQDPNVGVAAVVIADGLTGTDGQKWCQYNAYSGYSEASISSSFGSAWWPYFKWICESPSPIPASDMVFNHVACGIYNDYYGETATLKGWYKMDEAGVGSISFKMPHQERTNGPGVQNWEKTSVAVLLIDLQSGEIIGGDKMEASEYVPECSVENVTAASSYKVYQEGDALKVVAEAGATVAVIAADGKVLGSYEMADDVLTINGNAFEGVLMVRVNKGNNSNIAKVLWK